MSKSHILPHPCFIHPVPVDRDVCKLSLGLEGYRVIGTFGFISRHKGIDMAIRSLLSLNDDVVLNIGGTPRTRDDELYLSELRSLVYRLRLEGRVLFSGFISESDIPVFMGATDLALYPYHKNVASGALQYPLAYGVPVLASDVGVFRDIGVNEKCIANFQNNDQNDLNNKIISLFDNPYELKELGYRGRLYSEKIRVENLCARLEKIYAEE